jgi:RNA polymerase sigma factor for flagellar operon FliA
MWWLLLCSFFEKVNVTNVSVFGNSSNQRKEKYHMRIQTATYSPMPNPTYEAEQAVLAHLPMVHSLARRMQGRLPPNVDIEDLFSAGSVGLVEALAKFNPAKEIRFSGFAQFRIRGAILDSLRVLDWAPRAIRRKGRAMQKAIRTLAARDIHAPSEEEIADELKISLADYQQLKSELRSLEIGALYRLREGDSGEEEMVYAPARPEDDPLVRCMGEEVKHRIAGAIRDLCNPERKVTTLWYYKGMNVSEIGVALGMPGNVVSRIRASAIGHLRSTLSDLAPRSGSAPLCIAGARAKKSKVTLSSNTAA